MPRSTPQAELRTRPVAARVVVVAAIGLGACLFAGCMREHPQSMLHTAGPGAATVATLWWALLAICGGVFAVTFGLLIAAISVRRQDDRDRLPGSRFIAVAGVFVPAVILLVILVVSLQATVGLTAREQESRTVRVIGHQWWWEVHYVGEGIVSANEIYIPANTPVRFELLTGDVIHSFWVPNLGGKMDMVPEHPNYLTLEADRPGEFRGQCAEYCGGPHAKMAFPLIVLPPEEFDAWLAANKPLPPEPASEHLRHGREVFFSAACDNCHALAGTDAQGRIGPDLSRLGVRRTLGAGAVVNNRENLIEWIRDPHVAKPGNLMPHSTLSQSDLDALADFLLSLR